MPMKEKNFKKLFINKKRSYRKKVKSHITMDVKGYKPREVSLNYGEN
jgi:hypothetical protein